MNRAERRRQERAHRKTPVLIAGDGIVAAGLGQQYEAHPAATLPPKQPGKHRWVALGAWSLSAQTLERIRDPDTRKFLDNENLLSLTVGCWDCEEPITSGAAGRPCHGEDREL